MIRILALLLAALLAVPAGAGQYCVIDPPRAASGSGFYVAKPSDQRAVTSSDTAYRLFDPSGAEFRIRGVNHNHWDMTNAYAGIPATGANAVRMVLPGTLQGSTKSFDPTYVASMIQRFLDAGLVPLVGDWRGTCKAETVPFDLAIASWISARPMLAAFDNRILINLANEWGPSAGATARIDGKNVYVPNYTWRDKNIEGMLRMRAAGYPNTLVIDAGNCGQDATTVARDGAAVLAADPLHNVLFDIHVYGSFHKPATASWMQDYDTAMAALAASKLPIILGEFGPGRNIGPSPTLVAPEAIIATAEANSWGWMAWAYGDNNLPACQADDNGFSMTRKCGQYLSDDDLTAFGRTVVPLLKTTAKRASP